MGETSSIAHKDTNIGKFCSIAHDVFIGTSQHPTNFLTTHGFAYCEYWPKLYGDIKTSKENIKDISYLNKPCNIGNDVWIGRGVIVKDGVNIGDGAIIGSGAIVTKDIPPYAIAAGMPAVVKKYRFDEATIKELLTLKWWDLPKEFLTTLPFDDIQECIKLIKNYKKSKLNL